MPEPISSRLAVNGVELQLYEWPGEGRPIFLAHATGFHARCWDQVVAHLPGRHVYAIDMRGHGLSSKPEPPYPWRNFGDDVAAVARALGFRDVLAAGHSKGGFATTRAAAHEPGAFSALLLIDPVIMPRSAYGQQAGGEHFAARRRNNWASPEEMFESFRPRQPFASWDEQVLRDYCTYGLLPNPEGEGYVLACPPRIEAAVYAGSAGEGSIYDDIATIDIPVRVLRARQRQEGAPIDMSSSPTAPDLASHFKHAEDIFLPHYSHFIPMEDPAFVAKQILEMA
ncbi:MAG: alpha/beta fold hydrolase [Hyphomicrobiales bacterium]